MKKLIIIFIILTSLSCSENDNANSEKVSIGLLKKEIRYFKFGGKKVSSEYNYYYENDNMLSQIIRVNNYDEIYPINSTFFYENNLIVKSEWLIQGNDNFQGKSYYEYDGNGKLIKYIRDLGQYGTSVYFYTYLENETIIVDYYSGSSIDEIDYEKTIELEFKNGNLISNQYLTFEYNNKVSPYYGILGLDKIYFVEKYDDEFNFPTYYNSLKSIQSIYSNQTNFTYEYNSKNKPTLKYADENNYVEYYYY